MATALLFIAQMLGLSGQSGAKRWFERQCGVVVFIGLVLQAGSIAYGSQSLALAWDPSPDTNVVGYFLYYGTSSGTYTTRLNVGTNITAIVPGLKEGQTYFFAVTAYNAQALESGPSNEVNFIVPGLLRVASGSLPVRLSFAVAPGHNYQVQATADFHSWLTIWQTNCATNCWVTFADPQAVFQPSRFYRLYFQP